jgi:MGT family glycosyltransferase
MQPVAIIGMDCIFPGAPGLERYWHNIQQGVDAIAEVPEHRCGKVFFDPDSDEVDRFYCRRGGFVDDYAEFDPIEFGIMPKAVAAAEPDQLLSLRVGAGALRDAGYLDRDFPRERTAVILGRGNYAGAGTLRLQQHARMVQQMLQTLQDLVPDIDVRQLQWVRKQLKEQLDHCGPEAAAGVIPNLAASRLANRLDLRGPAYTVDAACASTLIAIEQACQSLTRGDCAMALTGGLHLTHDLTFWATFCQLGALSRSQQIRPLSQDADGILAGEGIGLLVLKRLRDAEADHDRIYAVLHGVGSASDGRSSSLLAPSVEGQLLALRRAWQYTVLRPDQIGLLEAHGTGTPAGDQAELETVRQFFGELADSTSRAVIGSVKSMIGHAMPAAGAAGLIKAALAIYHGVLPPTLHCERPHALLEATRFRAIASQEPWPEADVRIAAVNAFGFGGINAHVVLSSAHAAKACPRLRRQTTRWPQIVVIAADSKESVLEKLAARRWNLEAQPGRFRLAMVEPSDARLDLARKVVTAGTPWRGQQQIYFSADQLLARGKLAFLFPGVDSSFDPRVEDVVENFHLPSPRYAKKLDPAKDLLKVALGVYEADRVMFKALEAMGIKADAMAGHSLGEWCAMAACDMLPLQFVHSAIQQVQTEAMPDIDLLFLAVACTEEQALEVLDGLPGISLSHDNCPHQVIFCGREAPIYGALDRFRARRIFTQVLPFVSGFHSPGFAPHIERYQEFFRNTPLQEPSVPLWSATTGREFPTAMAQKQQLAVEHLLRPVRFRQLIDNLYAQGFRAFLQVGTGSLVGFVADTLKGRAHLTISANIEKRSGLHQLAHVAAALWAEGGQLDSSLLGLEAQSSRQSSRGALQRLSLGVPLIKLKTPLARTMPAASTMTAAAESWCALGTTDDPLQHAFSSVLSDIRQAGRDVLVLWQQRQKVRSDPHARFPRPFDVCVERRLDVSTTVPLVRDHSFHREREGWPVLADCRPVVPLTMELELLRQALEEQVPGRVVIAFEQIVAFRWLLVAEPVDIKMHLSMREYPLVEVSIEGFLRGRAVIAQDYPATPARRLEPLRNSRACSITASDLYTQNWMFHREAYRGVTRLGPVGDNGIAGALTVTPGPGALLDNMGQLAGFWVMETQAHAPLAMPIGVQMVRFYRQQPAVGETFECQIQIDRLDEQNCWSDQQLLDPAGSLVMEMRGWHTRRYQMTREFYRRTRQVESSLLCDDTGAPFVLFEDVHDTANMREYIALRVLNQPELREYESLSPRRKREWLNGRIAAKDAVRHYLWRTTGYRPLFPKELLISSAPNGQPLVKPHITAPYLGSLHISISHKGRWAAAIAARAPVGIDIETVEARTDSFLEVAFGTEELQLLPVENRDEWLARAWAAKEVLGKLDGTGLKGNPRCFRVEAIQNDRIRVNGLWVETLRHGNDVIAGEGRENEFHCRSGADPGDQRGHPRVRGGGLDTGLRDQRAYQLQRRPGAREHRVRDHRGWIAAAFRCADRSHRVVVGADIRRSDRAACRQCRRVCREPSCQPGASLMARILVVVPPLTGHINPALSVATELRYRGHEVVWAVHRELVPDLLPTDVEVHSLPSCSDLELGPRSGGVRGLESVKFFYERFCLPLARASLQPLQAIVQTVQPDLMICDHQMLAGALVARALEIPWFTLASTNVSILKMSGVIDAWLEDQLAHVQRDYGLSVQARPDFSSHGVIVFSSEAMPGGKYAYYEAPYHFVGPAFTHRPVQLEFPWSELRADAARLLISLGTVSRDRGLRFYEVMMDALDNLTLSDTYLSRRSLQVVMVAPRELRDRPPSNFIVQPRVPQIEVLAQMDAVLCHAGHNTVCEALSFGLPLIVAPIRDDQPIVARQVIDAGAGLFMRYGRVTVATARTAVETLFREPGYRDGARRLKESFRGLGGAIQAASILDRFVRGEVLVPNGHARLARHGASHAVG